MYLVLVYAQIVFIFIVIFSQYLLRQRALSLLNWFLLLFLIVFPLSALYVHYFDAFSVIGVNFIRFEESYIDAAFVCFMSLFFVVLFYCIGISFSRFGGFGIEFGSNVRDSIWFLLFLGVGVGAFFILMKKFGGVGAFLGGVSAYRSGGGVGLGFLQYPGTMLLPILLFMFISKGDAEQNYRCRFLYVIVFFVFLLPVVILGFRGPVIILLLQFLIVYNAFVSRVSLSKLVVVGGVIFSSFTFWAYLREPQLFGLGGCTFCKLVGDTVVFRTRGIEVVAAILSKPQLVEYNFFVPNFIESVTSIIPRSVYAEKGYSTTEIITTAYFSADLYSIGIIKEVYGGVSSTYIGQSYWAHGFSGVLIVSCVFGFLLAVVQKMFVVGEQNNIVVIFYSVVFSHLHLFVESFQLAINAMIMNFAVLCLLSIFMGKRIHSVVVAG